MRTEARFPLADPGAGHYESFFLKAAPPEGGRAFWLRHTVHKRPGAEPTAALWLTLFDADAPGPRALKQSFAGGGLSVPTGAYIQIGEAVLEPVRATGSIEVGGERASWDLRLSDGDRPFFHLPHRRMYEAALPRTKVLSPHPGARFDGRLHLGDAEFAVDGWPGTVGHNWGSEHAERWTWIHASGLGGQQGSYLDIAAGRIKLGPLTTPWVANGVLHLDRVDHRLGGIGRLLSTRIHERPTSCELQLAGKGIKLRGRVSSEPRNFVAWIYADPDGPEHNVLNCSISDLELEVERGSGGVERLEVAGAAAYELGMRQTDHGIPVQPYPDG